MKSSQTMQVTTSQFIQSEVKLTSASSEGDPKDQDKDQNQADLTIHIRPDPNGLNPPKIQYDSTLKRNYLTYECHLKEQPLDVKLDHLMVKGQQVVGQLKN